MTSVAHLVKALRERELLDAADARLVAWLCDHAKLEDGEDSNEDAVMLTLVSAALCRACAEGSLCLPLDQEGLGGALRELLSAGEFPDPDAEATAIATRFLEALRSGRLADVAGTPDAPRPLVEAHGNLYLHRFWYAEQTVATGLQAMSRSPLRPLSASARDTIRRETLEESPLRAQDGSPIILEAKQREALEVSLRERVFVLAGGPGTGKTTWTAAWLRAVLRHPGVSPDRVRLCAPTGRAARRLEESLRATLAGCMENPIDRAAAATPVSTLHSLLGWRAFEGRFARGPEDPLDADWVLLDEASMADVFLMAALVRALKPGTCLVLAGDPGQLPAVAAGAVLAELLPEVLPEKLPKKDGDSAPMASVTLEVSHRARGAVIPLASAVRRGDADEVLSLLGAPASPEDPLADTLDIMRIAPSADTAQDLRVLLHGWANTMYETPKGKEPGYAALLERFRTLTREQEADALNALWESAGRARVLAPLRRGTVSADHANRILRELLEPKWRKRGDTPAFAGAGAQAGFHGAPILVTRNDPRTGLSNGDLGLWLETAEGAAVFFPRPELPGKWLRLPVTLLPACEPGFATTVHKSQGSECDEVLILLPEADNRLLARETLYTAITRARKTVRVFGSEDAVRQAVERRMRREGGLRKMMNYELRHVRSPQGERTITS